ncbi:TPA: hypothetical protein G8B71_005166 [Salmonella enterica]|nr:hypothetical protein [Salmonella enterica subsp. enterica serovar Goldcoast]HAF3203208.1 hypothetical protein [Salmonella enterica]HAF3203652.1 hypothetical protein [Salmonella enterica]
MENSSVKFDSILIFAASFNFSSAHSLKKKDGSPYHITCSCCSARVNPTNRGRLRERAKSYAKALANDILR